VFSISVRGAVLGSMIAQSGIVFGRRVRLSCYADFPLFLESIGT
jgi:hypothetical protein